jgi:hypothetical protein
VERALAAMTMFPDSRLFREVATRVRVELAE